MILYVVDSWTALARSCHLVKRPDYPVHTVAHGDHAHEAGAAKGSAPQSSTSWLVPYSSLLSLYSPVRLLTQNVCRDFPPWIRRLSTFDGEAQRTFPAIPLIPENDLLLVQHGTRAGGFGSGVHCGHAARA